MTARAIWKATIRAGEASIPVKLYSAVEDRRIHFRLLHKKDRAPVKQQMVLPSSGEPVAKEEITKAVQAEPGVFVPLELDDLAALEPAPSREIEVVRVVPAAEIESHWYDRPYLLGPEGPNADSYAALARGLAERQRVGVARWVMRKRRYVGALRAHGGHLLLATLRHAAEVVSINQLERPSGRAPESQEVRLAEQLVESLSAPFDLSAFQDEHRERVMQLIEAKRRGTTFPKERYRKSPRKVPSLEDALRKSLERVKEASCG